MKTLLIVYHSMTGGTLQMAQAAATGARSEPGLRVSLLRAEDAQASDVLDQVNGKPYAILICAGSDGRNAAQQIERIATGWRLRAIADPIIVCTHAQTPQAILRPKHIAEDDLKQCEELGD